MRACALTVAVASALVLTAAASAATITKHATTKSYALTLDVGPMETMYTEAQVKSMHPKSGEVMLEGGSMNSAMAMKGALERHLEVHVTSRASGKVVTNVKPLISITDSTARTMSTKVNAVAMEGVGAGMSDVHYGNNVALTPGHSYEVSVSINGEKASFTFKA